MTKVTISGLCKAYQPEHPILQSLDLTIASGELFFLLGPSGCGKSTLLRILAGLITPDRGTIRFNDTDVTALPPEKRQATMVFQNYALWPHLTVFENVAFGLRVAGADNRTIKREVAAALDLVRLGDCADRRTPSLSGGQQQRVALARALAVNPAVLLLDEPLSNLDARLRDEMRLEIRRITKERGLTAIYVTHDRREALSMADRMAVLEGGRISQMGRPDELYRRPVLKNMHPINLDRIARSFQSLKIVMAHMGTKIFQDEASQYIKMLPNLYADLGGCGQWLRMQPADLAEMLCPDTVTVDRSMNNFRKIVLGSDAYVNHPQIVREGGEHYERLLKRIGVPGDIIAEVMGKTVASWMDVELDEPEI